MFNLFKRFLPKKHELQFPRKCRNRIYRDCLEIVEEHIEVQPNQDVFCCHAIIHVCKFVYLIHLHVDEIKNEFPELYKLRKKKRNHLVWFNDNQHRVVALKKCIEQTKCD